MLEVTFGGGVKARRSTSNRIFGLDRHCDRIGPAEQTDAATFDADQNSGGQAAYPNGHAALDSAPGPIVVEKAKPGPIPFIGFEAYARIRRYV